MAFQIITPRMARELTALGIFMAATLAFASYKDNTTKAQAEAGLAECTDALKTDFSRASKEMHADGLTTYKDGQWLLRLTNGQHCILR